MTALVAAGMALAWFAAAGEAPSFDAFFQEFAKKRDGIHVLEARFTQETVSPEETIESGGSIVYVKPKRIIFRYEKPKEGPTYLIQDGKAYEFEADIKQLQIYDLENNPQTEVFFLGFDQNTDSLRENYDVSVFDSDDKAKGAEGILIRPKKKGEDTGRFSEVRLFLRDEDYLPYRIQIVNDDDTKVNIAVSEFIVNGKLDLAKTCIALPEGTKIIEDDKYVETVGVGGKSVPANAAVSVQSLDAPAAKETPKP
jgi:outer membrane lipoprotein-sorting protein